MAQVTIYVPDETARTMGKYKKSLNVSDICQQAIAAEIEKRTRLMIVSQNARLSSLDIPPHAILRVNVAYMKTTGDLDAALDGIKNDVFLDLPAGRRKPPRPVLTLADVLDAMRRHRRVRYFGGADAKDVRALKILLRKIPKSVRLIPRISSRAGAEKLKEVANALPYETKHVMLDKDDLFADMGRDGDRFPDYLQALRDQCAKVEVQLIELAGVIFLSPGKG